ncbi:MAG: hypothetical protein AB1430_21580 [Pseudomonadota bacterium]
MPKKDGPPTPEEVGKTFRISKVRATGSALGKPDGFDDVLRRSFERAPQRQRPSRKPPGDR